MPERIDENKLTERKNLTERRFEFQVRSAAAGDGKGEELYVEGYASVFDSPTVLFEYEGREYKEQICRGAFEGCQMSDVIFNYNHSGKVMARTRNKTLELNIDDTGVFVRARLDGTEEGRTLYEEIKGGYIDRMSFAFTVNEEDYDKSEHQFNVRGVKRLYDVSAVSIPAYDDTSISARKNFILEAEAQEKEKRAAEAALAERKENLLKRLNKGENK